MRRILLLAALLPALPAMAPAQEGLPRHPDALVFPPSAWRAPGGGGHRHDLPGGAALYLVEDRSLPLTEVVVALRAGAFLDPPQRPGLSYLATQLLPRGGTSARPATDFDVTLEGLGGRLTSRWTPSFAALGLSVPSPSLGRALDLFFEILATPGMREENLTALAANLAEGMARRNDDAVSVLEREWEALLYGRDHFSTRALTPGDVQETTREDLLAFHRRWWRPENFVIAAAGDFEAGSLTAELARRLAGWPGEPAPIPWPPPPPASGAEAGLFELRREISQAKVLLGHRSPEVPAGERAALALLAEVLGGSGAVSRIQGRLRTVEGLVYRSSARLEVGDLWPGDLRVFFETAPERVGRAVELASEELRRLREQAVPAAELEVARANLLGLLRRSFDTPEERAGYLAENALLGRGEDHWEAYRAGIEAVSPEDVRRAARAYLRPEELIVLVVGPGGEGTASLARRYGAPHLLPHRDPLTLQVVGSPP